MCWQEEIGLIPFLTFHPGQGNHPAVRKKAYGFSIFEYVFMAVLMCVALFKTCTGRLTFFLVHFSRAVHTILAAGSISQLQAALHLAKGKGSFMNFCSFEIFVVG